MISYKSLKLSQDYLAAHPYILGVYANNLLRFSSFNRFLVDPVDPIERIYSLIYLIFNFMGDMSGAGLIGMGVGLVNTGMKETQNENQRTWQERQNQNAISATSQENRDNRTWQTRERESSQRFQQTMQEIQNQFVREQLAEERAYNTPVAQAQRLNDIGLSANGDNIGAQDNTFGVPSSVSVPTAPSAGTPGMPATSAAGVNIGEPLLGGLQSVGSFFKDVSQADLAKGETERLYKLMAGEYVKQQLDIKVSQVDALCKQQTGLEKSWLDLKLGYAELRNLDASEYEKRMSALNKQADSFLKDAQTLLTKEQYLDLVVKVRNAQTYWDTYIDSIRSLSQSNLASAYKSMQEGYKAKAETQTINDSRQYIVDTLKTDSQAAFKKLDGLQLDNDIKIIESVDKMFGYDVGLGAQIKAYLIALAPNTRAQALNAIKSMIEDKDKVDAVTHATTTQTANY